MNFPFYIARRYLFSKKSTHAINIISGISVGGVAVATMALVVTLSVFNGFRDLVATLFTSFDPQLMVVPAEGKTAPADDPLLAKIRQFPEVDVATETLEDQALAVYGDRQAMVTVKGVDDNFAELTHINDILYGDGTFDLHAANLQYGTLGIQLAQNLGTGVRWNGYLHIYAPKREGQLDMMNIADGFEEDSLLSPGEIFAVKQAKYDRSYIVAPIAFTRSLFDGQGMISALEMRLKAGSDLDDVKEKMQEVVGEKYSVLDRYEQQADTFRIMKIEKLMAYIFLTFDVVTLRNLGATDSQIISIFRMEGRMIALMGAVIGVTIGLLLCWVQQTFGIVALGSESGSFVVDAYPVSVHPWDIVMVFFTVLAAGWLAVWFVERSTLRRR